MKQYICIDIGGTEIKHGIMDETELFLAKDKTPTEASKGGPCLLKKKPVPVVLSFGDETPSEVILDFPLAVVLHHFLKFSLTDRAFFLHRPGIFCFYAAQISQHLCTGCSLHQIAMVPHF